MPNGFFKTDCFPTYPGPKGVPRVRRPHMKVIRDYTYTGEKGDLLNAYLKLYPGDIRVHVAKINTEMKRKHRKAAELTLGEYVTWDGLMFAAVLYVQRGHELWDEPEVPRRFRKPPGFGAIMSRNRFDEIKSSILAAFADPSRKGEDPWWEISPLIDGFNDNRRESIIISEEIIPDELMSAFQPRTTSSGDLEHVSFVERKPKRLGTEMKCATDGRHGAMLRLEMQEGAESMKRKRFRDTHKPAEATALRLVHGLNGWEMQID